MLLPSDAPRRPSSRPKYKTVIPKSKGYLINDIPTMAVKPPQTAAKNTAVKTAWSISQAR